MNDRIDLLHESPGRQQGKRAAGANVNRPEPDPERYYGIRWTLPRWHRARFERAPKSFSRVILINGLLSARSPHDRNNAKI
jgi:hypothetical protein